MDAKIDSSPEQETRSQIETGHETRGYSVRRLERRIRYFSIAEVTMYLIASTSFAWRDMMTNRYYFNPLISITSPEVMFALAATFVAIFAFMLNGATPIVSFLSRNRGHFGIQAIPISPISDAPRPMLTHLQRGEEAATEAHNFDPIEDNFATYINRSQEAARVAQRRPNALLFVGTIIAAVGLIFFVMTLPGSRYGFLDASPASPPDLKGDFWSSMILLIPRLLMLIFIQVLAGFFLRQYRSSMEEFRYYESVLRHREAQYLSYTLRKKMDDKKALLKFADELLKEQEFGRIGKGQSTTVLEAQRTELNEFSTLYEKFASLFTRAEKSEKTKPSA